MLFDWAKQGEDVSADLEKALDAYDRDVQSGEIRTMLSGELDRKNAIVTIHPGAGGTESQDWAEMLMRMYLRWTERRGFKRDVIDLQPGDEAGIKSVTLTVVRATTPMACSRPKPACTGWCASRPTIRRRAGTPRLRPSTSGPNCPTTSRSRSRTKTSASTRFAPAGPAAST